MFWRRSKSSWPVESSKVQLGSVVDLRGQHLGRTHVRVKYLRESQAQFVPLVTFVQRCQEALRDGKPLRIDHLLVAPIIKQRYAEFFDRLTDWGPATRRALGSRTGPQRRELEDDRH